MSRGWLLTEIGDPLAERLQAGIRLAVEDGARVPPFEVFLFTGDSKQQLVDRLNLRLSARRVSFPSHRVLLGELRGFEYLGSAGASGRPGARGSGHDDVVMALALAVWVCPEAAAVGLGNRLLLGSSVGGLNSTTRSRPRSKLILQTMICKITGK